VTQGNRQILTDTIVKELFADHDPGR